MSTVYAVVLVVGILGLTGWVVAHSLAESAQRPERDPERRLGVPGRRVVGALVGFGMAGMSAEYAARDISAPLAFSIAVAGALAAAWWAGTIGAEE